MPAILGYNEHTHHDANQASEGPVDGESLDAR